MSKSLNYTSSLPADLLARVEYIKSFRAASEEREIDDMAEEGLDDYLKILDD